jgi:hypothetical protein
LCSFPSPVNDRVRAFSTNVVDGAFSLAEPDCCKVAAKLTAPGVCSALLEDLVLTVEEFFFRTPTRDVEPQPEPEGGRGLTSGITISDDGTDKREVATNSRVGLSFFTLADKA